MPYLLVAPASLHIYPAPRYYSASRHPLFDRCGDHKEVILVGRGVGEEHMRMIAPRKPTRVPSHIQLCRNVSAGNSRNDISNLLDLRVDTTVLVFISLAIAWWGAIIYNIPWKLYLDCKALEAERRTGEH